MTKKEMKEMMLEIKGEMDAAKQNAITKDDMKAMMIEMMSGDKPAGKPVVKAEVVAEVKPEVKLGVDGKVVVAEVTPEPTITKEDMVDFMKGFRNQDGEEEINDQSVKAQGGGEISLFKKSSGSIAGYGF